MARSPALSECLQQPILSSSSLALNELGKCHRLSAVEHALQQASAILYAREKEHCTISLSRARLTPVLRIPLLRMILLQRGQIAALLIHQRLGPVQ
jgi:hypothetical protein